MIFGKRPRGIVKRRQVARAKEFAGKSIHILSPRDAEGQVVQAAGLSVIWERIVRFVGTHDPDIGLAISGAEIVAAVVFDAVFKEIEEFTIEVDVGNVQLDVIEEGFHCLAITSGC